MPIIENRRFLIISGAYVLLVFSIALASVEADTPVLDELARESLVYKAFGVAIGLPAAIALSWVTFSALGHTLRSRNYGWLAMIVLFAYAGAYAYGFYVTARQKSRRRS